MDYEYVKWHRVRIVSLLRGTTYQNLLMVDLFGLDIPLVMIIILWQFHLLILYSGIQVRVTKIFRTFDGGINWEHITSLINYNIKDICFIDSLTIYAMWMGCLQVY